MPMASGDRFHLFMPQRRVTDVYVPIYLRRRSVSSVSCSKELVNSHPVLLDRCEALSNAGESRFDRMPEIQFNRTLAWYGTLRLGSDIYERLPVALLSPRRYFTMIVAFIPKTSCTRQTYSNVPARENVRV